MSAPDPYADLPEGALPPERLDPLLNADLDANPDAADDAAEAKAKLRAKIEARAAENFWRSVFGMPAGRREMWKLLTRLHAFETQLPVSPTGFPYPEAAWFEFGKTMEGNAILQDWMLVALDGVTAMLREHDGRFKAREENR